MADNLAKAATLRAVVDKNIKLELEDAYRTVTNYCNKKWQQAWDASNKGRHYYSITPSVTQKTTLVATTRAKEIAITRLRLGKCRLNYYMFELNLHPDGLCTVCKLPETVNHYLLECKDGLLSRAVKQQCLKLHIEPQLDVILNSSSILDVIFSNLDRKL